MPRLLHRHRAAGAHAPDEPTARIHRATILQKYPQFAQLGFRAALSCRRLDGRQERASWRRPWRAWSAGGQVPPMSPAGDRPRLARGVSTVCAAGFSLIRDFCGQRLPEAGRGFTPRPASFPPRGAAYGVVGASHAVELLVELGDVRSHYVIKETARFGRNLHGHPNTAQAIACTDCIKAADVFSTCRAPRAA